MSLNFEQMMTHGDRRAIIRRMAGAFIELHVADPRAGTVFSTQQRWLMAHAGMALCFRALTGEGPAMYGGLFLERIEAEEIAARNTAHAFLMEMLKYNVICYRTPGAKGKTRPLVLADTTIAGISGWLLLHLAMLDAFDGGTRCALFQKAPDCVWHLQPAVSDQLIAAQSMRVPKGAFAHFTWLNEGGFVMDCLMAGLQPTPDEFGRLLTGVNSIAEIAEQARLSRTHLGRKLRVAEDEGFLGWTDRRGRSTLWLSTEFREEYEAYQIGKLALIERAFGTVAERLSQLAGPR